MHANTAVHACWCASLPLQHTDYTTLQAPSCSPNAVVLCCAVLLCVVPVWNQVGLAFVFFCMAVGVLLPLLLAACAFLVITWLWACGTFVSIGSTPAMSQAGFALMILVQTYAFVAGGDMITCEEGRGWQLSAHLWQHVAGRAATCQQCCMMLSVLSNSSAWSACATAK